MLCETLLSRLNALYYFFNKQLCTAGSKVHPVAERLLDPSLTKLGNVKKAKIFSLALGNLSLSLNYNICLEICFLVI